MNTLLEIKEATHVKDLSFPQLWELKSNLDDLGYYDGSPTEGIEGNTIKALIRFKQKYFDKFPRWHEYVGKSTIQVLKREHRKISQKPTQSSMFVKYDLSSRDKVVKAIIEECDRQGLILIPQKSYTLATAEHETGNSFRPVGEAYWLKDPDSWRKKHCAHYSGGWRYYGRGFVQLTHDYNYDKYGDLLGIPLLENPDLAYDPNYALFILVHGMKNGIFTTRKLETYINENKTDYYNARKVINGLDRAKDIETLAKKWESKLKQLLLS